MRRSPRKIESDVQLLVEGKDSEGFFNALIGHLGITNVQIQDFGGVTDLRNFLRAFVNGPDFSRVTSIGIVRDAESCSRGAFESVQGSLKGVELPVPQVARQLVGDRPAIAVMILPSENRAGMLETLLNETLRGDKERAASTLSFGVLKNTSASLRTDRTRLVPRLTWQPRKIRTFQSAMPRCGDTGISTTKRWNRSVHSYARLRLLDKTSSKILSPCPTLA